MDANLSLMTTNTGNPLQIGTSAPPAASKSAIGKVMSGEDFANLMRSLLPVDQRQSLAAQGPDAQSIGLKTSQLGSQFDLVTSEAPLPDDKSLAAFAKSQGLTDGAVQALFGDLKPLQIKSLALDHSVAATGAAQATPQSMLSDSISSALNGQTAAPVWFNAVPGQANGLVGMPAPPLLGANEALGWGHAMPKSSASTELLNAVVEPTDSTGMDVTGLALTRLLAQNGAQAWIKPTDASHVLGPQVSSAAPADLDPNQPINLNALRMNLIPAWENVTRQLASVNGSGQAQKWANLINGWGNTSQKAGSAESIIDLGGGVGDIVDKGDGMGQVSATFNSDNHIQLPNAATQAPSLNLNGQPATQGAATATTSDSANQIAQMAEKLSQALSERLQSQIEQGQWKVELKLKPAQLGKISVELGMNAGGLDAVFKTDNPMTRDLLVQSTQRLRDNLEQAGMTVANVWVNQNNQQGTGGNSTPWQQATPQTAVEPQVKEAQATQNMSNIAKSSDGWDQLV